MDSKAFHTRQGLLGGEELPLLVAFIYPENITEESSLRQVSRPPKEPGSLALDCFLKFGVALSCFLFPSLFYIGSRSCYLVYLLSLELVLEWLGMDIP